MGLKFATQYATKPKRITNYQPSWVNYNNDKVADAISKLPVLQFPRNSILTHWINWKIELSEGVYDFSKLKNNIILAAPKGYSSIICIHSSATDFAHDWLKKYNTPIRAEKKKKKKINYDVSNPKFHK